MCGPLPLRIVARANLFQLGRQFVNWGYVGMAESIVEGAVASINIDGTPVPLKKLSLGHFKTLEKEYGSVDDALNSMKGIGYAIFLCAKRAGYQGTLESVEDNIDVDLIQDIIVKISGQDHFVIHHDVAQLIAKFVTATEGLNEENAPESAAAFIEENHEPLQQLKGQCQAIRSSNQGEA